ncbi:MAG TPA: hypothetical protein PKV67_08235 [Hyphomonas sp.]|nr:hypothetical protein [Hyphomonas sp.]HRJ00753.1 hypothetical protein [Hyphomonas sp.]HRK66764.1 hypothetical protein [Hyphomonas sp.]
MSNFWKTWMQIWCWGVILFGAVLAGGAFPATDAAVRTLYSILGGAPATPEMFDAPGMRFSVGLMGAVTLGWGATILGLLPAIHQAGAPAWRGLTLALAIWFVIDGAISVATGYGLNNLPNTALAALYFIPVLTTGVLKRSAG